MKLCYSYEHRRFYFTDPAAPGKPLDPEPHIVRFGDEQRAFFKSEFIARSYLEIFGVGRPPAQNHAAPSVADPRVAVPNSTVVLSSADAARCTELLKELLHRLDSSRPLPISADTPLLQVA